jgi:hypothetical protein
MVELLRVFLASTCALVVTDGRLAPTLWDLSQIIAMAKIGVLRLSVHPQAKIHHKRLAALRES